MKYVKTFENFDYQVNEEFIGGLWKSLKDKFTSWRNKKAQDLADKILTAVDKLPEDKKAEMYAEGKELLDKVDPKDLSLAEQMKKDADSAIEKVEKDPEVAAKVGEVSEGLINEELDWKTAIGTVLKVLGFSISMVGLVTWFIACLQGYGVLGAIGGTMLFSIAWIPVLAVVSALFVGPIIRIIGSGMKGELK